MRTRSPAFLHYLAGAACLVGDISLARAAPPPPAAPSALVSRLAQCNGLDQAFPQPGHLAPSGGNTFRPLPTLKPAGKLAAPRTLGLDLTLQRPGGSAGAIQIGDYLVQDVPAFVAALRNGTAVDALTAPGGPVSFLAACLADPRWLYGGTHWALQQGDTISEHLRSALQDAAGSSPATPSAQLNPPANGGVPCRATNTHTHGLLVSPYHPVRPGSGPYGDYVLDVTLSPGAPLDADTCASAPVLAGECTAADAAIQAMVSDLVPFEQGGWINAHHDSVPVPRGDGGPCPGDPLASAGCPRPGRVTILVNFDRAEQVGDFVYHCHILEHEDGGMMARVQIRCPPGLPGCPVQIGATAMMHQH